MRVQHDQPFRTTSIWRNNDRFIPVCYIVLYPLKDSWLSIQIVNRYIKEALAEEFKLLFGFKENSLQQNVSTMEMTSLVWQFWIRDCQVRWNHTWIWDAWRSIVIMWSAPATESILATSFADIGALLYIEKYNITCKWRHIP